MEEWIYEDCSGVKRIDPEGRFVSVAYPCVICEKNTHRLDDSFNVMLHEGSCWDQYSAWLDDLREEFKEAIYRRQDVSSEWTQN